MTFFSFRLNYSSHGSFKGWPVKYPVNPVNSYVPFRYRVLLADEARTTVPYRSLGLRRAVRGCSRNPSGPIPSKRFRLCSSYGTLRSSRTTGPRMYSAIEMCSQVRTASEQRYFVQNDVFGNVFFARNIRRIDVFEYNNLTAFPPPLQKRTFCGGCKKT